MTNKTRSILSFFEEISKIPRPTRGEEKIANYLLNWANENNLEAKKDETGNVLIYISPSEGYEDKETITIQGHMDMVCEKTPQSKIDPNTDSLKLIYDGDWLKADGTTLGADNGIAIAYAMQAAIDKDILHPRLELLFTIAEEDGFDGVHGLKPNSLKGKYLINLDSSDFGVFTIASASTQNAQSLLKLSKTNIDSELDFISISLDGLLGGHSGIDIFKKRANAALALMWTLKSISDLMPMHIIEFNGGTRRNVIPRNATSIIAISKDKKEELQNIVNYCLKYIKDEYTEEVNPIYTITDVKAKSMGLSIHDTKKVINFVTNLPNGVESWSKTLENTIEASNNIAIVKLEDSGLSVLSLQRGAISEGLERITNKFIEVSKNFGINEEDIQIQTKIAKPWEPNSNSLLLKKAQKVFNKLFGKDAVVASTHGGLECACIGEKHEGMEMISFGPDIRDLHSPQERLYIPSVEPVWNILVGILGDKS